MKKLLLSFIFLGLVVLLVPHGASAAFVNCGNSDNGSDACTIGNLFGILPTIFDWLLLIAIPLAGLMITVGGVFMLLSGVNAGWFAKGKSMVIWSIIAVLIILGSVLIINTLFAALGYTEAWNSLPF